MLSTLKPKRVYAEVDITIEGEHPKVMRIPSWSEQFKLAGRLLYGKENAGRLVDYQKYYGVDCIVYTDHDDSPILPAITRWSSCLTIMSSNRSCWLLLCKILNNPDIVRNIFDRLHPASTHQFYAALPNLFVDNISKPHERSDFNYAHLLNYWTTHGSTKTLTDALAHYMCIPYIPLPAWERITRTNHAFHMKVIDHIRKENCKECTVRKPVHWKGPQPATKEYIEKHTHTTKWRFRVDKEARQCFAEVLIELREELNGKPLGFDDYGNYVYGENSLLAQIDMVQEIQKGKTLHEDDYENWLYKYTDIDVIYRNDIPVENRDWYICMSGWRPTYYSWIYHMRAHGRTIRRRCWRIDWTYTVEQRMTFDKFIDLFPEEIVACKKRLFPWVQKLDRYDTPIEPYNYRILEPRAHWKRSANGQTSHRLMSNRDNLFV